MKAISITEELMFGLSVKQSLIKVKMHIINMTHNEYDTMVPVLRKFPTSSSLLAKKLFQSGFLKVSSPSLLLMTFLDLLTDYKSELI